MPAKVKLAIEGMTCAACQSFVEKALREQAGVRAATVNLMLNTATVEFDEGVVSEAALAAAVEDTGYGAKVIEAGRSASEAEQERDRQLEEEFRGLRRKALPSLAMGLVMMAAMPFLGHEAGWWAWTQFGMAAVVAGWAGRSFYEKAWAALKRGRADMNVLVAVGTGAAMGISTVSAAWPHWFHGHGMMPQIYFEAVVFIIALVLVGKMLEARAKRQTAAALGQLAGLQPKQAVVVREGVERVVAIGELRRGDVLVVKPGERVAADGEVVDGASAVDESMLTGESLPVEKAAGSKVYGGTQNGQGALRVRVTATGAESVLEQIIRVVREAQEGKAPVQALADRVSAVFVPVVVGVAAAVFGWWVMVGGADALRAGVIAVAVLVISCPCAMGLAVPTAILAATGQAARRGILVRGGEALERLARVDTVVLDKTGTITEGRPEVVRVSGEVLEVAAALEQYSEHPLARAIVEAAAGRALGRVEGFVAEPGVGVSGKVEGRAVAVRAGAGRGVVEVVVEGKVRGEIELRDRVKATSREAVASLQAMGMRVVMLSGDRVEAARAVAAEVGITEVIAEVKPAGKVAAVAELQAAGRRVVMVGDGLNDAAALEQAEVGMAMAAGSDLAIEAGDVALLRGDLRGVGEGIALGRMAMRVMRQNLGWAFVYNVVGIPVAAMGLLNPGLAAGAMALSSVSVVLNSLRLR